MNKKFITFLVILLVVLNLTTLGFLWFGKSDRREYEREHDRGPGAFLIRELRLTDTQQKQFEILKHEHHSQVMQIQDSMHLLREAFYNELKSDRITLADSLRKKIGEGQSSIERVTFEHFRKVRALCNPEQQIIFDRIIQKALRMMAPPQERNGPPPPPPPHPPDR